MTLKNDWTSGDAFTADDANDVADEVNAAVSALDGKVPTTRTVSAGAGLTGGGDLTANRTLSADFGSAAGKVCQGNDSRLSDARTPTAHSHGAGDLPSSTTGMGFVVDEDDMSSNSATKVPTQQSVKAYVDAKAIPADISLIVFGKDTARATGTGDNPFGVKLQRAITVQSFFARVATADASGNLVVELRKNGSAVSGTSHSIAAASQVAGTEKTGLSAAFAAGDILTVQVTGVGTTPGKGLVVDVKAVVA